MRECELCSRPIHYTERLCAKDKRAVAKAKREYKKELKQRVYA